MINFYLFQVAAIYLPHFIITNSSWSQLTLPTTFQSSTPSTLLLLSPNLMHSHWPAQTSKQMGCQPLSIIHPQIKTSSKPNQPMQKHLSQRSWICSIHHHFRVQTPLLSSHTLAHTTPAHVPGALTPSFHRQSFHPLPHRSHPNRPSTPTHKTLNLVPTKPDKCQNTYQWVHLFVASFYFFFQTTIMSPQSSIAKSASIPVSITPRPPCHSVHSVNVLIIFALIICPGFLIDSHTSTCMHHYANPFRTFTLACLSPCHGHYCYHNLICWFIPLSHLNDVLSDIVMSHGCMRVLYGQIK